MDVVIGALVNAFESRSIKHLTDHRVQVSKCGEWCLTLTTLLGPIGLNAVAAHDLVTALAVSRIDCDVFTVCAGGTREHGIWACVQLLQLRLYLSDCRVDQQLRLGGVQFRSGTVLMVISSCRHRIVYKLQIYFT